MRPGVRVGVDVGEVRIGVARSDHSGVLAVPVEVVPRGDGDLRRLAEIVTAYDAIEVVVGLPLSMSGREGPAAAKVRDFVAGLVAAVGDTPVRLVDERLSTVEATRGMRAGGTSSARGRQRVDSAAAAVIVQTALDRERATGVPAGHLVVAAGGADRGDKAERS